MALTKLSITEKQVEIVRCLAERGYSGVNIAVKLKISQSTIWRNMEILGLNNKQKNRKKI